MIHTICRVLAWMCRLLGRVRVIDAPDGSPYLERFVLWGRVSDDPGFWLVNVWLHRIHCPDADRATHNHPWFWAKSLVLSGGYCERRTRYRGSMLDVRRPSDRAHAFFFRNPWHVYTLRPRDYHRIDYVRPNTWTLFVTGRTTPDGWGFLTPEGHVDSREYLRNS